MYVNITLSTYVEFQVCIWMFKYILIASSSHLTFEVHT